MYSIKQNQLIMGALPLADVTMHYMDIRAAGKRYDEFYEQAKDMGAAYIRGRVAKITEQPDGNLVLRYEDVENGGQIVEAEYDLVVLAVGIQPNRDVERLFINVELGLDEFHYVAEPAADLEPGPHRHPRRVRRRHGVRREGHRRLDPARGRRRRAGRRASRAGQNGRGGAGMNEA